jgi:hypothetical protein
MLLRSSIVKLFFEDEDQDARVVEIHTTIVGVEREGP